MPTLDAEHSVNNWLHQNLQAKEYKVQTRSNHNMLHCSGGGGVVVAVVVSQ